MGIPDHLTCLLRNRDADQGATVRTGHGKMHWFQIGKEYVKAVYCHPAYLTYMQSTSCEKPGWMDHKLESRLLGEITTQICRWYNSSCRKWRGTKEPLDEGERVEWKSWLKALTEKLRSWHLVSSLHGKWRNSGNSSWLYFGGLQNHCIWWLQRWNWKTLTPWRESYDQPRQHGNPTSPS